LVIDKKKMTMKNDTLKIHVAFVFLLLLLFGCNVFCFYTLFCFALQRICVYVRVYFFFGDFYLLNLATKKQESSIEKIKALFILHTEGSALCVFFLVFSLERTVLFSLIYIQCYRMVWPLFCRSIPIDMSFPTMHQLTITYIDATSYLDIQP
jgi:hypothetical protein